MQGLGVFGAPPQRPRGLYGVRPFDIGLRSRLGQNVHPKANLENSERGLPGWLFLRVQGFQGLGPWVPSALNPKPVWRNPTPRSQTHWVAIARSCGNYVVEGRRLP